ncbi:serine/threonine-protein kinase [Nocardia vulneris]|uniref:serine/threonine-protein kinase n=1 Tax=Nocardia vulneris TaxID=1141657 RepID=UPI0007A3C006|nr:serine/threonine-protein kinase [Nocardia vulneris]
MVVQPGTRFAGFTIERVLGAGGMGIVYLARHPRMPRRVALKVLTDSFHTDRKTRSAFDREARLAAGLEHPNIVSVYDRSAAEDPALWLAMRYIDGGDAAGLLGGHPDGLAPERVVRLLTDAAHALDYAHAQGVLHRDVKPANLLIEHDVRHGERAVLTDFGIARTLDDTVTLSGIAATFAYAAPERFSDAVADHRADVYSLGCTLFQLLTGQHPFPRKDQAAVIGAHLAAPPPTPRERRPDLPAALDIVIATAMAKSPGDRYDSCTALAEATAQALTRTSPPLETPRPEPFPIRAAQPADLALRTGDNGSARSAPTVANALGGAASGDGLARTTATVIGNAALVPPPDGVDALSAKPVEHGAAASVLPDSEGAARSAPTAADGSTQAVPAPGGEVVAVVRHGAGRVAVGQLPERARSATPGGAKSWLRAGGSGKPRRVAVGAGVLVTGVGVVVGTVFAVRGDDASPGQGTTTSAVRQQTTSNPPAPTTTLAPTTVAVTSAPLPADAPPPDDVAPPGDTLSPAQPAPPVLAPPVQQRPQPQQQQAPPVVPQTRVHQWPG